MRMPCLSSPRCMVHVHGHALQEIYERKRAEHYWKEKGRWDRQDQVFNRHENVLNTKRDMGEGGVRRNASSESYNIISLEYARNAEGQRLKDKVRASAQGKACVDHGFL